MPSYDFPGASYDAWKTRLPDDDSDWPGDDEDDFHDEEEYFYSLEQMMLPPPGIGWIRELDAVDVYPDDDLFEHMGWEI